MKILRSTDQRIPRKPLLWLAAALLFTVPPMFMTLAPWVPAIYLAALLAKFWMEPRGYRVRSALWKLLFTVVSLAAIFATYGSLNGMEPGVSIIVVLVSLKMLEAHTARELQVLVMVGWILCLCGFVLSQELGTSLWLIVAFVLLLVALIQFHQGPAVRWTSPIRPALKILAQAIPLIVALFLFFPRFTPGLRIQMARTGTAASGFSGTLSPSSVSNLANSSAIAFRVQFPDGKMPPVTSMYWRGAVLRDCAGLEWRAPESPATTPRSSWRTPNDQAMRQLITIEPHGGRWMFALDAPIAPPPGTLLAPGDYLWSPQPIRSARQYQVTSIPATGPVLLHDRERQLLLNVPAWISPRTRQLVRSWQTPGTSPRLTIQRALEFFRANEFRYSLSPGEYQPDDLDGFLFQRRVGFCEHYAAAFATLSRLAGVPARVVLGYLGGEYNDVGNFVIVRQSDAHAWCEVWFADTGWQRIDPTGVVAPDRLRLGAGAFAQSTVAAGVSGGAFGQGQWLRTLLSRGLAKQVRVTWESLKYEWETRVVSFDTEAQDSLFGMLAREVGPIFAFPFRSIVMSVSVCLLMIAAIVGRRYLHRRNPPTSYERFCQRVAALGVARPLWEGPLEHGQRAAQSIPAMADPIRAIVSDYVALRYAADPNPTLAPRFSQNVRAFLASTRSLALSRARTPNLRSYSAKRCGENNRSA